MRQVRMIVGSSVSEFKEADVELISEPHRLPDEAFRRLVVLRKRATVVQVRKADEELAEKPGTDVAQGKKTAHGLTFDCFERVDLMPEAPTQNLQPRRVEAQWHFAPSEQELLPGS